MISHEQALLRLSKKLKISKSLAKKIGLSTAGLLLPEGVSSALGAAGLAWSAYDLMKLAEELPELYDFFIGRLISVITPKLATSMG